MAKRNKIDVEAIVADANDTSAPETLNNDLPTVEGAEPSVKKPKTPRAGKAFKLAIGTMPEPTQKPLGTHAVVITEAISALVAEGKEIATREEIMTKAQELGLYEKKPSVQGLNAIFSWWRAMIIGQGWLIAVEAPVAEEVAAPAEAVEAPASM